MLKSSCRHTIFASFATASAMYCSAFAMFFSFSKAPVNWIIAALVNAISATSG